MREYFVGRVSCEDRAVVFLSVWWWEGGEGADFGAKRVKDNLACDEESKNGVNE